MAEDNHTSHGRSLLKHLRLPIKRDSGIIEHHDLASGATKKMRLLLAIASTLLIITVVGLHAVGGIVLLKTGPGGFSVHNPIGYILIGLSLVFALFKLKHVVGVPR